MKKNGFTIVEMLVVLGILAMVCAIATPVILRAKEAAKEAKCASNLHELWEAMALYRERYGGPAYGNPFAMGFPPHTKWPTLESGMPIEVHGCVGIPSPGATQAAYTYMVPIPGRSGIELMQRWEAYSKEVGEHMILWVDPNHMQPEIQQSPFTTKRVQGIYLDGQLKKLLKRGDWSDYSFWK